MSYQDFPPALLTLSPRLTKAGDPSASVVGVNTTLLGDGAFCYCIENKGEYQLDRADNSTPPDGDLVLAPLSGPGRWFKRLPVATPPGASAVVKLGFDSAVQGSVHNGSTGFVSVLRRDAVTPLQVQLTGITPGNVLAIDASGMPLHVPNGNTHLHSFVLVVSFNGNTVYSPGNGFFRINNSLSENNPDAGNNVGLRTVFRCYAAVVIPPGATIATVQVAYSAEDGFFLVGQENFPGAGGVALSATEYLSSAVPQPGPFLLVEYV